MAQAYSRNSLGAIRNLINRLGGIFIEGDYMEESVLKYAEFGVLGIITLLLLTKGLTALNELTKTTATLSEAQKALADSIKTLAEKVSDMGSRLSNVTFQIEGIEKRLDKLEENSTRNFNELRDLIKSKTRKE